MVFGYSKFYIEDSGVKRLKDLISEDYEADFKRLSEDSYFKKNKNKVIGPLRVVNGRNEREIQTKISLVSLGRFKDGKDDIFEKIYLLECWIPDIYTQLQIAGPKEPTQSTRMIELEDDPTMAANFHLAKRVFTLGKRKEQDVVEFSNVKFFLNMHTYFSTKDVSKFNRDFGKGIATKFLLPNGIVADRPPWLLTEEDLDADLELAAKPSEDEKEKELKALQEAEQKEKQSSAHDWSLESKVNQNDLHGKMLAKKVDGSFTYLRYLLVCRLI